MHASITTQLPNARAHTHEKSYANGALPLDASALAAACTGQMNTICDMKSVKRPPMSVYLKSVNDKIDGDWRVFELQCERVRAVDISGPHLRGGGENGGLGHRLQGERLCALGKSDENNRIRGKACGVCGMGARTRTYMLT